LVQALQIKLSDITDLRMVDVKTDSTYLAKGMTQWVRKWERNGYRTAKGTPVVNAHIFQLLEQVIQLLKQ